MLLYGGQLKLNAELRNQDPQNESGNREELYATLITMYQEYR